MEIRDEEIQLEFLVSGSYDALPSSYLKLRSYLNIHSSNLAKIHNLKLPECFTKTNLSCLHCFLPWSHETCSIKLLPVKKLKKKFSKIKVDSNKASSGLDVPRNHLVLKCRFCNKRSHFYLPKNKKTIKIDTKEENQLERKKKKKRRKKDKICGLHKCLKTSLKKSPKGSSNKMKSSSLNPNRASSLTTTGINAVQQVNTKVKNSHSVSQLPTNKNQQTIRSKKIYINPVKNQCKTSKKKIKNLQKLQQMVQEQKEPLKKTLKDFLNVI